MKYKIKTLLTFLFTILIFQVQAQVDKIIAQYPNHFVSTNELVSKIEKDFTTDKDKANAAFSWIAMNIAYDTKLVSKPNRVRFSYRTEKELLAKKKQYRIDLAEQSLKKKKALCEAYSTLYQILCNKMSIECEIVPGTAKRYVSEIGKSNLPSNHAWNAIKINNKWLLVDVTWAAGWVDYSKMQFHKEFSPAYFASSPEEFAMKHYPDDRKWLLLPNAFTKKDFALQACVFNNFFGKNYQIIKPKQGIINIKKGDNIQFSLRNIPVNIQIAYHFKKEKYGQMVKPIRKKDEIIFEIPTNLKVKDELIIYFNNKAVLAYKIQIK